MRHCSLCFWWREARGGFERRRLPISIDTNIDAKVNPRTINIHATNFYCERLFRAGVRMRL
jgi:hypothetical protein